MRAHTISEPHLHIYSVYAYIPKSRTYTIQEFAQPWTHKILINAQKFSYYNLFPGILRMHFHPAIRLGFSSLLQSLQVWINSLHQVALSGVHTHTHTHTHRYHTRTPYMGKNDYSQCNNCAVIAVNVLRHSGNPQPPTNLRQNHLFVYKVCCSDES